MYPRSPPTAGKNLEFCQPGEDLPTDLNQLVQPLPQVLHVSGVDFAALVGTFGVLVEVVAAHLKQIRHAAQLLQVEVQPNRRFYRPENSPGRQLGGGDHNVE